MNVIGLIGIELDKLMNRDLFLLMKLSVDSRVAYLSYPSPTVIIIKKRVGLISDYVP